MIFTFAEGLIAVKASAKKVMEHVNAEHSLFHCCLAELHCTTVYVGILQEIHIPHKHRHINTLANIHFTANAQPNQLSSALTLVVRGKKIQIAIVSKTTVVRLFK